MTLALLLTAVTGAWAKMETQKVTIAEFLAAEVSNDVLYELTGTVSNITNTTYGNFDLTDNTGTVYVYGLLTLDGQSKQFASMGIEEGTNITIITPRSEYNGNPQGKNAILKSINPKGPEVTINDPKTVATMTMPASDVTVNYELVRDITQKVNVETRIDGAATERIRIAKDNDGHYKFVTKQGWQFAAVDKLDNNKDLTNGELTYTLKMKVGNEYVAKNFDTELCPGTWRLEATANAEKPYEGTAYGPDIELYAGYEITVPAGEYATFYKDENLYTEDENAELYTISEVNATQAVLSDAVQIMPKNTPMLVYNKGTEKKTFLLIPTEDEANQVTAANEFKGTLSTMGMPGSTSITDYYVCTGKAFRWVKNAGTIGANKCWLQIGEQPATTRANTRSIVGGGNTTGIDGIENDESAVEGYYDLNGRKLQGKPTRGGIYIQNGRKVIVR
jgi:hypothetical protein